MTANHQVVLPFHFADSSLRTRPAKRPAASPGAAVVNFEANPDNVRALTLLQDGTSG
jgi:hypothetical protein